MRFSTLAILCSVFAASTLASPVDSSSLNESDGPVSKRCCILCDNNNRCGSNDKRQPVQTTHEVFFGNAEREDTAGLSKRCCILCDNPYARCGSSGSEKREAVETEHEALFGVVKRDHLDHVALWPSKRCCILCDNPYARCGSNDKRDVFQTLEEAFEGTLN